MNQINKQNIISIIIINRGIFFRRMIWLLKNNPTEKNPESNASGFFVWDKGGRQMKTTIAIPEKALENISAKASELDIIMEKSKRFFSGKEGIIALELSGSISTINEFVGWYRVCKFN